MPEIGAPDVTCVHRFLPLISRQVPLDSERFLDAGCGRGIMGALMKIYRPAKEIVGIDMFEPYLEFCRGLGIYTRVLKHDLRTALPFDDRYFDVALAVEVIEHMAKKDGLHLLEELERVSTRVIVTTPNGLYYQPAYDANPHQKHRSAWKPRDFRKRNYRVHGAGFVFGRRIRGLSYSMSWISYFAPFLGETLIATWTREN